MEEYVDFPGGSQRGISKLLSWLQGPKLIYASARGA